MSVYRPKPDLSGEKTPTALNIKGSRFYLSCVKKDGQPVLQLEVRTSSLDPEGGLGEGWGVLMSPPPGNAIPPRPSQACSQGLHPWW